MTKLDGTAGQFFPVIADAINARGMARSGKGVGAPANAGFRDLLHAVASPARRASGDQDRSESIKPGLLRARAALLAELDKPGDGPARKPADTAEDQDASSLSAKSDGAAAVDCPDKSTFASTAPPFPTVPPDVKPRTQTADDGEEAAPARKGRPTLSRELRGTNAASARKDVAESGSRAPADAPQAIDASSEDATHPHPAPAADGFEAVAASIERSARGGGREALPAATKLTVVQQETHLPPVQPFTAGAQIAKAVLSELEGSAVPQSPAASSLASVRDSVAEQPLKTLTISLEPAALGNVTVRLRLVGAAVSVHLAADRKDTSQMLDQQRDSIRELMQSAGYVADVAPVRHGALDGFQPGSPQSQNSFSGQPQPQGAQGESGASPGQSQDGARQPRKDQQANQETRHGQDVGPHHRRGAVYL
jgi:chemotaxis protein MotD